MMNVIRDLQRGKIIARKPRGVDMEFVLVEVDNGEWCSATVDAHSLRNGSWYWGHYFHTLSAAMKHFNGR